MECDKWVEEGLLLVSDELDETRKTAYESHVASCETCRSEMKKYRTERSEVYSCDLLSLATSKEFDQKILDACAKTPRPAVSAGLFSFALKRVVVATLFLVVGFGGGLYVVYNVERARNEQAALVVPQNPPAAAQVETESDLAARELPVEGMDVASADSAGADSAWTGAEARVVNRGGEASSGVIPVDVRGK